MRIFPFLIAIAVAIEALAGTAVAKMVMQSLRDTRRESGAPAFTQLFFGRPELLWIIPVIVAVYALSIGMPRERSVTSLWNFVGASAIGAALLLGIILTAGFLPLLTFKD